MDYFDFCHFSLNPTVNASAVSAEGHEVTNLISDDISKKEKGFMVYRTINPPVDVTFNFMCKINISHIIIWPQVGNQKSSGFQISTYTGKSGLAHTNSNAYVNVGTAFLQNEPGIVFHHAYEPSSSSTRNFLYRRLSTRMNSLSAVRSVQIRIMKTQQSSVPALLKIEIWGLPSVSCPKEVRMKVLELWKQKDKKSEVVKKEEKKSDECTLRSTALSLINKNFEIPEDFLDPITCEVMVLPFILPSGKTIDQRTLEKHENHEANWGRRPSDPFTGKLYTETSKPVLAVALKARIDKFLIEHANEDEIKKVPRTLGRKSNNSSSLKESSIEAMKDVLAQQNSVKITEKIFDQVIDHKEHKLRRSSVDKRKEICELPETANKKVKIEEASCSTLEALPNIIIDDDGDDDDDDDHDLASSESCPKRSHEDMLNDSLDAALKSALSGLPSFTNFTPKIQAIEHKCSVCSEKEILYVLPCQHLLCRICLTKKTSDKDCKCLCCNLSFKSADPKRFYP